MRPKNDNLLYLYLVSLINEKGGHNIATNGHNTVLWVIFTVFFYVFFFQLFDQIVISHKPFLSQKYIFTINNTKE